VVYNREYHPFTIKDVVRILKAVYDYDRMIELGEYLNPLAETLCTIMAYYKTPKEAIEAYWDELLRLVIEKMPDYFEFFGFSGGSFGGGGASRWWKIFFPWLNPPPPPPNKGGI